MKKADSTKKTSKDGKNITLQFVEIDGEVFLKVASFKKAILMLKKAIQKNSNPPASDLLIQMLEYIAKMLTYEEK